MQWYVDITLRLIAMAGDHVSDEVWQRVIQIVTNNEELQVYAARNTLQYVKQDHCHETLVKIGNLHPGRIRPPGGPRRRAAAPLRQFLALQSKLPACSSGTKAMILSCFVKFVNLFPEIKPQLVHVFDVFSHTLDSELQQACLRVSGSRQPADRRPPANHLRRDAALPRAPSRPSCLACTRSTPTPATSGRGWSEGKTPTRTRRNWAWPR